MQDASKALAVAAEARTIQPYHPDVLNVQGEAQSASGDKPGAVTTFATLVKIVPESPLAHYRLATAYMAKEDYVAAADSFRNALKLKSDYLDAKAGLALVEYRAGKYDESLALAQQIQRQDPKLAVGYSLEGDSLMAQQKFGPAASAYEKAFARRQSGIVATKLHGALSQAGKIKEAEDRLLKWLQSHPTDTGSRLYLANAYINAVQNQQAIEQYQLVLRNDAKNLLALNNLATLLRQQNDPRALDFFEQSYKLKPDNVTITENLGWALVERGKLTRGVELLRKAAGQAPDNPEIRYHLAAALAKSGETALARSELERLLAKNTEFRHRDEAAALLKQL